MFDTGNTSFGGGWFLDHLLESHFSKHCAKMFMAWPLLYTAFVRDYCLLEYFEYESKLMRYEGSIVLHAQRYETSATSVSSPCIHGDSRVVSHMPLGALFAEAPPPTYFEASSLLGSMKAPSVSRSLSS